MENEVINKDNIQELEDFKKDIQLNFPKEFENIEPIQRTFETKEQFFEYVKQQNDIISKAIIDYDGPEHMYLFPAYFSFILSFESEDISAIQQDLEETFLKLLALFNEYAYDELGEKGFERIDFNTLIDISSEPHDLEVNNLPPATIENASSQVEIPVQESEQNQLRQIKRFNFVKNKNQRKKIANMLTKLTSNAEPDESSLSEQDSGSSIEDYQDVFPVDNKKFTQSQNVTDKQKSKIKDSNESEANNTSNETENSEEDKGRNLIPPEVNASTLNQDVSFSDLYPDIDSDQLLSDLYTAWLDKIVSKSFYKVIFSYRNNYVNNVIVYDDPKFLWDLVKAISSCITHLAIEAQQNPAASLLFETYYDGLVDCLNSVVHAKSEVDVTSAYEHMLNLLNLSIDAFSSELEDDSSTEEQQEDSFM